MGDGKKFFFFNGKKRKESLNGTWNFEYLKFAASA